MRKFAARSVSDPRKPPMAPRKEPRWTEKGSAAITTLVGLGMFLVMFTVFAQFAVWQYGRGVLRSAALEAARAGAPHGALPGACERRFDDVREGLLAGAMAAEVSAPRCLIAADTVTVVVDASFQRWLPISPDWSFTVTAIAAREVPPE